MCHLELVNTLEIAYTCNAFHFSVNMVTAILWKTF